MGLVVNQELANLTFADILDELDLGDPDAVIRLPDRIRHRSVLRGGPVEKSCGFVLHTADYHSGNTYKVTEEIGLTATLDVLKAMAFGPAPKASLFALGVVAGVPASSNGKSPRTAGSRCRSIAPCSSMCRSNSATKRRWKSSTSPAPH